MAEKDTEPTDLMSMIRAKRRRNENAAAADTQKLPGSQYLEHPVSKTLPHSDTAFNRALGAYKPQDADDIFEPAPNTGFQTDISPPAPNSSSKTTADEATAPNDSADMTRGIPSQAYPPSQPEPVPEADAVQSSPSKPQSPASSVLSEDLEDVDLRSPSDDPDYDFIEHSEATHSARNAHPDRADKYPDMEVQPSSSRKEVGKGAKADGKSSGKKSWRRGWFS
jgi:hypothetical protein